MPAGPDTPLLMLIDHEVHGGAGGAPGQNGRGGAGAPGGDGGSSYSWSEDESYTDSNGQRQTRTNYRSNSGGWRGSNGASGSSGQAQVGRGAVGADGSFSIEVTTDAGVIAYASRYDLRLGSFAHDSLNADCVYEPGELVRVFELEVENTGGMPTPAKDELRLALVAGGWVKPEPGELQCVPGLAPGERYKVPGELRFRIADAPPPTPGDPLEVEESILHRAMLPSVRRDFEAYQAGDALDAGRFVIRFPARVSPVTSLRSLAAGEATRLKFTIVDQSQLALGAGSESKRVVRVRVTTAADSELGDDHVVFVAGGTQLAPSTGWVHDVELVGAGESAELELVLAMREGAPEYRRFAAEVALELGAIDEPAVTRTIQRRAIDVRVARAFAVADADLLLVVNHRTTREELEAWQALGAELAFELAIWDLSREGHLDLEAPRSDGISLADWFAHKAIVILDNEIDGPDGPIHPHAFLAPDQATRAAAAGIDLAFIGRGPALRELLVPPPVETALAPPESPGPAPAIVLASAVADAPRVITPVYRRHALRFWARPVDAWLAREACATSAQLQAAHPDRRYVVIHRFLPEVISKVLWIKRWRVGTLEAIRTLDAAAGAIVHAKLDDRTLHDPARAERTAERTATALLVMFGFDENLARLRTKLADPAATAEVLDAIVDALVLDLVNELDAVLAVGWRDGVDLTAALPRLATLTREPLAATYGTAAGNALIRLAGRLRFFADSQVRWWEALPPWRWLRRSTGTSAWIARALDRFLAGTFGAHNLVTARGASRAITGELARDHRRERKDKLAAPRRAWALALARARLAETGVTSDTQLLSTSDERVFSGYEYDAIVAAKAKASEQRRRLVGATNEAHRELAVTQAAAPEH